MKGPNILFIKLGFCYTNKSCLDKRYVCTAAPIIKPEKPVLLDTSPSSVHKILKRDVKIFTNN